MTVLRNACLQFFEIHRIEIIKAIANERDVDQTRLDVDNVFAGLELGAQSLRILGIVRKALQRQPHGFQRAGLLRRFRQAMLVLRRLVDRRHHGFQSVSAFVHGDLPHASRTRSSISRLTALSASMARS